MITGFTRSKAAFLGCALAAYMRSLVIDKHMEQLSAVGSRFVFLNRMNVEPA